MNMLNEELASWLSKAKFPETGRLVETGTGYGHSALFFSNLLPKWRIYTIDGFGLFGDGRIYDRLDHDKVSRVLEYYSIGRNNIIQILGNSQKIPWELPIDILYIDADHTEKGCKADFMLYGPFVKSPGLIIFDDYLQPDNLTNGVKAVVDSIYNVRKWFVGNAALIQKLY